MAPKNPKKKAAPKSKAAPKEKATKAKPPPKHKKEKAEKKKPKKPKKALPKKKKGPSGNTVKALLATIGMDDPAADLADCGNLDDEFKVVKRAYIKAVLKHHPDKGGDREAGASIFYGTPPSKSLRGVVG
jgi:hypothetical protein